jgi:predicted transcriptional regulator
MNKEEIINQVCDCFKINITLNELEKIIDDLQKKAELGEHYKYLYSEVKKQKDDVVEYIKTAIEDGDYFEADIDSDIQPASHDKYVNSVDILRMLGEIDVKD